MALKKWVEFLSKPPDKGDFLVECEQSIQYPVDASWSWLPLH